MSEMPVQSHPSPVGEAPNSVAVAALKEAILNHLHFDLGKDQFSATVVDYYHAVAHAVRDRLMGKWIQTQQAYYQQDVKRIYYLSMEFLIGRNLANSLVNLGLWEPVRVVLAELGLDPDELMATEWDAGLGSGGLGRLAACFLDSMATLGIAGYGYGIRYDFGGFAQRIENGYQIEIPDEWLQLGNPWEIGRVEELYHVQFHGRVHSYQDPDGRLRYDWVDTEEVLAMAYDTPIPGYCNGVVNTLRLWSARSPRGLDLNLFQSGEYLHAVANRERSEAISHVLYPADKLHSGKELRLKQQYFMVSASLQDIVRRYKKVHRGFDQFSQRVAIQLNDTHPALAIPELLRLLVDREGVGWERAWEITVATFGYTNHTLLSEALEEWSVDLLGRILPRHLQIIFEINWRFLQEVARSYPGDVRRLRRMSLIEEEDGRRVRMSQLAVVGSHAVNGVSELHGKLLRRELFHDFCEFYPQRFTFKTNGITPRRWLKIANPSLAALISATIGDDWVTDLSQLERLTACATHMGFQDQWAHVKQFNKSRLCRFVQGQCGITLNLESIFDCQFKRIHEYKRQLLNVLHVITLYCQIKSNAGVDLAPRTVLIGGKAAPGYDLAKLIIKLIHSVADVVNCDPHVGDRLRLVFLPNYGVTLAETLIPAADLSQQISTAGTEASGTSNMKFALNGAVTIGTLDGANIEIRADIGADNMFTFGLTAEQADALRAANYNPWSYVHRDDRLHQAIDMIRDGYFSPKERGVFRPILDSLFVAGDRYLVLADFGDYLACQKRIAEAYRDRSAWLRKSILNTARIGRFSSDRTIRDYAREIWGLDLPATK